MALNYDSLSTEEKLKYTLFHHVSGICDETGKTNTLLGEFTVSKEAKELITELLWKKLEVYALDLEAFALHAKRNTINPEDVRLLFRRNPSLLSEFDKIDEEDEKLGEGEKGKSRKRKRTEAVVDKEVPVVVVPD